MFHIKPDPFILIRTRQIIPIIIQQVPFMVNEISYLIYDNLLTALLFGGIGVWIMVGFWDLVFLDVFKDAWLGEVALEGGFDVFLMGF